MHIDGDDFIAPIESFEALFEKVYFVAIDDDGSDGVLFGLHVMLRFSVVC